MELYKLNGFWTRSACVLGFVTPAFLAGWASATNKQFQFAPLIEKLQASVSGA
jgi:hypothetical protein